MARRIKSTKRKYLGNRTYGGGNTKNRRGKGSRGGVGRAGYHKHKWLSTIKAGLNTSRRKGFKRYDGDGAEITLVLIQKNVNAGKYQKAADGKYEISLSERTKVLGQGELTAALKIRAGKFTAQAREKIEKAGGQILE